MQKSIQFHKYLCTDKPITVPRIIKYIEDPAFILKACTVHRKYEFIPSVTPSRRPVKPVFKERANLPDRHGLPTPFK